MTTAEMPGMIESGFIIGAAKVDSENRVSVMSIHLLLPGFLVLLSAGAVRAQVPLVPDVFQSQLCQSGTERARMVFLHCLRTQANLRNKLASPALLPAIAKEATLAEVLEFLCDRQDLTMVIDTNAFDRVGIKHVDKLSLKEFPKLTNPTVRQTLDAALGQIPANAGATFIIRRDYIEVTTLMEVEQTRQRRYLRLRMQLLEELPCCASLDAAGALLWTTLGDVLGHNLTD